MNGWNKDLPKTDYAENKTMSFSLNNKNFIKTFTFRRNGSNKAFIILNEKLNEVFNVEYHYNERNKFPNSIFSSQLSVPKFL